MNSMHYKGYTAKVEFSEEDGVFWGKVLGLPAHASITFEGDRVERLTQDFHNAIDFYIADCEKNGLKALKPASGKLMLRVAPEVHSAALIEAQARGMSLNQWAANVLQAAVRH
jgi:predicted HicB family RNase H-like nuclease